MGPELFPSFGHEGLGGATIGLLPTDVMRRKAFRHILLSQVNGWGHDVAWALPAQLDNVFAEVRFHAAQALGLEVLIQLELLRHHGLTLQHFPGTIALAQLKDDGPGRSRIGAQCTSPPRART